MRASSIPREPLSRIQDADTQAARYPNPGFHVGFHGFDKLACEEAVRVRVLIKDTPTQGQALVASPTIKTLKHVLQYRKLEVEDAHIRRPCKPTNNIERRKAQVRARVRKRTYAHA